MTTTLLDVNVLIALLDPGHPSHADAHAFFEDLDETILRPQFLEGHRQITDARPLALVVRNEGRLATFDRRLPVKAATGATERHLRFVGRVPRPQVPAHKVVRPA